MKNNGKDGQKPKEEMWKRGTKLKRGPNRY